MEDKEISYSEEDEPKSLLPFLEEDEKEDKAGQFSVAGEHWEDYKLEEELAGGGNMGNKDPSEGVPDESDSSMESLEHCLGDTYNIQPMKRTDRNCIFTLQRNLKELHDLAKEKEFVVQKSRGKLNTCQMRIKMLAKQLEYVDMEIEKEEEAGNVAALSRFQAMRRRLCMELEKEKDFELKIALDLEEDMLEMWQIEAEQGKHKMLHEQLKKAEEELEMEYQERAKVRIWKEKIAALQAEENQRSREKKEEEALKQYEERHKKLLEDAKRNHEKAVCFLRKSMARVREKNAKKEVKNREHMERRIQAVLSLKNSITSNQEKLQTLQVWNKAMAFEEKKQEMKMREAILAEGGNVTKELFLHKRLLEHEKEKQAFRERQKSRKIEIVSKILQEKAFIHKQKKSQSRTKAIKAGGKLEDSLPWRKKAWQYIEKTCKDSAGAVPQQSWCPPSACSSAGEGTASVAERSEKILQDVLCESSEDEKERDKTLVEPEFPGLWSQECDFHKVSKEEMDSKQLTTSIGEKEIFAKKREEFQTGIFHKKIVPGRECKRYTFYSKPNCIHFKDFDVGQTYKKKIALINASYSVNFCRLVGISESLKDFISIHFDPPGKMSAGMSCEVGVTFKPMINEILEGEVMFMAQTGSFSVPVKCTPKRCILALDKELIDFGSHVVGETISRTITLTNSGALGTRFKVQASAGDGGTCRAAKASPRRMMTQHFRDHVPEEKVSNSPVMSGVEKKEQICPDRGEKMTNCVAEGEQRRTERSRSCFIEQLDQDVLSSSSDLDTGNEHNLAEISHDETPVEIMLGKVTEGEIGPFSSVKLQVMFVPAIPGDVQAEFVIMFDNSDCKPLCFSAIGVSIDVPIWVTNPNIDLKICMYDQLYQDCVVIHSRAKTTLCLKFEVCKELSKHMELLPKTGYIQAQSSFSVQLKFLPRPSLPEDAGSYFHEEMRVLEVPVTILIVDQAKKVNFTVHAIVTTSDLEISPAQIDFGYCTIYEAVQANFTLTNKSILPQEFGFVGLPELKCDGGTFLNHHQLTNTNQYTFVDIKLVLVTVVSAHRTGIKDTTGTVEFVEIQPNDGLGILLPLESLTLDIIFKANEAKEYSFELTCKSEINRQFKLSCKAVGVHPPLELSHSLVQFAATALNGVSTATLYVMNSHVSANHFTHAVPRIGSGDPAAVGPTSFEFCVPEGCPVTITPSVGTVWPGKKSLIRVSFRPTLSDQLIREEAVRRLGRAAAAGAEIQERRKDDKRKGKKLSISRQQTSRQLVRDGGSKHLTALSGSEQPTAEELNPDSDAYMAAQAFLMRNFSGRFEKYVIPCFVASGHIDEKKGSENLSCSPYNTLYLELHCPAVAPAVVVTSDNGKNTVRFGDVAIGHRMTKRITVQNISPEKLELGFSVLNPNGPFLLGRPVGMLEPGENKTLSISFCPDEDKQFYETLDIWTARTNLTLSISGCGVMPSTVCSVGEVLDMGYVVAREKATSTFQIQNTSTLTLRYSIQLDSLSPTRDRDQQRLPSFLISPSQRTEFVGTQNYNGLSVFSVFPTEGEILAGKSQDFVVTFSPDHESLYYSDRLKVVLFDKRPAHVVLLKGAARDQPMFVEGGVPLDVPTESLAVTLPTASQEAPKGGLPEPVKSILLVLEYIEGEHSPVPAMTELRVGAIRTTQLASKKNVEFGLARLPLLQQEGFTLGAGEGSVESGQARPIRVSWVPPADFHADDPLLVTALLTLKSNVEERYQILFMAKVVSANAPTE